MTRLGRTALLAFSAVLVPVALLPACGQVGEANETRAVGTLERASELAEFPLYYAGDRVVGLPLAAVVRRRDTATYVSFVYGDCAPVGDEGCAPPAEVQVWPGPQRPPERYEAPRPGSSPPLWTTMRGRRAAVLDEGTRIELFTGPSTVVVFADTPERALALVRELRCIRARDRDLPPGGLLTC